MKTWELTEEEKLKLTTINRLKYETAVRYKGHGWACGSWGGWVRGDAILTELGWKMIKRTDGNRTFISLTKP